MGRAERGPLGGLLEGRIDYEDDLNTKLINAGDAPPGNQREAVVALRASAPKVRSIRWHRGAYHLFFDRFAPNPAKVSARFVALGFDQPLRLHVSGPEEGILLWPRPNA